MQESLLRAILTTVARQVFPPEKVVEILTAGSGGKKQVSAYDLCDGATPQSEIGKRVGLDRGNLSRSIARWVQAGIVVRIGANELPLHVYPISLSNNSKSK